MEIQAIKPVPYAGKGYKAGDVFDARPHDAKVLVAIGKARYFTRDHRAEPVQQPISPQIPAEIAEKPPENAETAPEKQEPEDKTEQAQRQKLSMKRTYNRRDQKADD